MGISRRRSVTTERRSLAGIVVALICAVLATACTQEVERVPEIFRPTNAHEAYKHSLAEANLGNSALGRDWIAAADSAMREPIEVTSPFQESGYFDQAVAGAVGYVFSARGGQRIEAAVELEATEPVRIFMDLFRLVDSDPMAPVHVATGAMLLDPPTANAPTPVGRPESFRRLQFEPLRDGIYVLRIQPELLRSTRYTVQLAADASLAFPVADHSTRSIQSTFGVERDGGRRSHHGVDIFAPRHTPVLAASDGTISRANTTEIGGNVVWVRDANRNMNLYYAHLETHNVETGQRVKAGDQLGTVGNSGNARTTPTHLHFGVYARGPVDPFPFLERTRGDAPEITADVVQIGGWSRARGNRVEILAAPDRRARVLGTIDRLTPFRVWAASSRWLRISLPDGRRGYVAGGSSEPATPLRREALVDAGRVLAQPRPRAPLIERLEAGAEVPVLGSFGDFLYVRTPGGLNGWLSFE